MAFENKVELNKKSYAPSSSKPDASSKLSAETNQIGMTGTLGSIKRFGFTTVDGIYHIPGGLYDAGVSILKHPEDLARTIAGSAAIGSALKIILPESGPVGKYASVAMATWFAIEAAPGFVAAYKTGQRANTWDEMHKSSEQWGAQVAQLGLSVGAGYVGYKIGAGLTGRALSAERFDAFADAKQEFWNNRTDQAKRLFRMDTSIPTAATVGLVPNFLTDGDKVTLLDSKRDAPSENIVRPLDTNTDINATVMLRSKASVLKMDRYIARMSRGRASVLTDVDGAFADRFGSTQESLTAVADFAHAHNLAVAESDLRSGRVLLTGKAADFQNAFSIKLNEYATETGTHTGHDGPVSFPKELAPHVRAVLGTDETPAVAPANRLYKIDASQSGDAATDFDAGSPQNFVKRGGYLATEIARAQNFPLSTGGEGQSGAFVSLSGGIDLPDYNKFFSDHGLEQPRPLGIKGVDGAVNSPNSPAGGDTENLLDAVQMQSIAPKSEIDMIIGPNNDQGLADVFERGVFPRPGETQKSVISSSWGLAENRQTAQALNTLGITFRQAVIRGVQIYAGAGDNGARANGEGYQPEYPAADPNVTGVGGLKMILGPDGKLAYAAAWDEGEHSSTGGGISKIFRMPFWQSQLGLFKNVDTGLTGRGVPDISTNAAKSTGFPVRVNGENQVIGGTSAGAPLYAGLSLNINAELAALNLKPVTPLNPWMYARANTPIFHDIDKGGNHGYESGKGWDPVTGLGWIDGQAMLDAMKANRTINIGPTLPFAPAGFFPRKSAGTNTSDAVSR